MHDTKCHWITLSKPNWQIKTADERQLVTLIPAAEGDRQLYVETCESRVRKHTKAK